MQALRDLVHPRIDQSDVCEGMWRTSRYKEGTMGIDPRHELVENRRNAVDV